MLRATFIIGFTIVCFLLRGQTIAAVIRALEEQVKYNRGDDYWPTYSTKIRNMNLQDINMAAQKVVKPSQMIWVVVGDRSKIEKGIRDLNLGEIHFIDSEGKEKKVF